ncbi:hypothetical protein ACTRXD_15110 [Nitrospira sp. T9]|uniref:hypothetical protein n=1 Tax=unclassified Nitrospira TaxID=2652172 RepID=UPI003F9D969E
MHKSFFFKRYFINNETCLFNSLFNEKWLFFSSSHFMFSKWVVLFWTIVGGVIFPLASGWAWEVNTHKELTKEAITVVEAHLSTHLIDNLGLEGGLNASLPGGTPITLMQQGSNDEDNGIRFFRHFHDPISNAGLAHFDSAIDWSLRSIGNQGGDAYSWNDAREYFFKALTSPTKAERDQNWSKTFRALGQVMHLLQDSANPSHVRDDPHPFDDGLHDYMERKSVDSYIGGGIFRPNPSMLEQVGATRAEPFSNLFDRNVYSGSNPQVTLGTDIGVTEYANANFFTDDTIPGQASIFNTEITYPTVTELVPAPIPSPYLTLPRLGSAAFSWARTAKLTGNKAVAKFLLTNTNLDLLGQLKLDDAVYEAQAQNLIPRAVGYSAAVLSYFFRGDLSLKNSEYSMCSNPDGTFQPGGHLGVDVEVPSNLLLEGQGAFYYDLPDGSRVHAVEGPVEPTNIELGGGKYILLNQLSFFTPVPWTIIFQGKMGPGAKEPHAVVALSGKAPWVDVKCPI